MAKNFENLDCWKSAIELATEVYEITKSFPKEETYGMVSQLRRASISVSANIAEGAGRATNKNFINFLNIALGSLNETESLTYVSYNLGYITKEQKGNLISLIEKCGQLIGGLKKYLKSLD